MLTYKLSDWFYREIDKIFSKNINIQRKSINSMLFEEKESLKIGSKGRESHNLLLWKSYIRLGQSMNNEAKEFDKISINHIDLIMHINKLKQDSIIFYLFNFQYFLTYLKNIYRYLFI
jgi:hypothetical protein